MAKRRRGSAGGRWARLPTEQVHPAGVELDRLPPKEILRLMAEEDLRVVEAVRREAAPIARAAAMMAESLAAGGRVLYAGAGTSGRLGVLEAAECPPTFGTRPERIQAVIAGGRGSVFRSREGAEDDEAEAVEAIGAKRVGANDVVVGISASSVTPFVESAIGAARRAGARTVLVTCGPRLRGIADVVIAMPVGAELLAGSTRMKAGTATKLALNQITLLAMIRLNKVYGPYMVDLKPGSAKLRDRAVRMIATLTPCRLEAAERYFREAGREVKTAVVMGRLGIDAGEARRRLAAVGSDLRRALAEC